MHTLSTLAPSRNDYTKYNNKPCPSMIVQFASAYPAAMNEYEIERPQITEAVQESQG